MRLKEQGAGRKEKKDKTLIPCALSLTPCACLLIY